MSNSKSCICVTGGSGFIASHVIRILLERGYRVNATVRDASSKVKTQHLLSLPGATAESDSGPGSSEKNRLKLFSADLDISDEKLAVSNWRSAIKDCQAVIHMATAVKPGCADPEAEIFKPAIQGTKFLLQAIAEEFSENNQKNQTNPGDGPDIALGFKTFVLTSSMSSVAPQPEPDVKSEIHWSDPEKQKERKNWYGCTKTTQERICEEYIANLNKMASESDSESGKKQNQIRYVAICPTGVFGHMLQPTINGTMGMIKNFCLNGKGGPGIPASNDSMSFIDVTDCAQMHVNAIENSEASGRYMCLSAVPVSDPETESGAKKKNIYRSEHWNDIFAMLKELYPAMPEVPKCEGVPVRETQFDLTKMNTLLHVEKMHKPKAVLERAVKCLIEKGEIP